MDDPHAGIPSRKGCKTFAGSDDSLFSDGREERYAFYAPKNIIQRRLYSIMARKKSQTIHWKGGETPDRSKNSERLPSTSTESYRSISPLFEETPKMMIDVPKDLNLPSSNHTSRPITPQDTIYRGQLALTEESILLKTALDSIRNTINNYKVLGVEPNSSMIQNQLKLQAIYEKSMQHVPNNKLPFPKSTQPIKRFLTPCPRPMALLPLHTSSIYSLLPGTSITGLTDSISPTKYESFQMSSLTTIKTHFHRHASTKRLPVNKYTSIYHQ
ncbi:hypothetical protein TNCV_358051 [Trichonephila clavipes]|nr:hypothetical protein TNCV_358051 [Trichonephila clavipes]